MRDERDRRRVFVWLTTAAREQGAAHPRVLEDERLVRAIARLTPRQIFMAPFRPAGDNPTLALQRDLELVQHLDRLGWDEAWIGEHHSAGTEIIASPEIFIATAAERTRNIKLGTGVISVSYHNPLWVAERAVLLDHLTRGRFMLGLGPGSLPTDAMMVGLDQSQTRELLAQGVDIIMQLLTSDQPVTFANDRWDLREARLHLRPYSNPLFDVAVAAVASPAGPQIAGKHGIGLLSVGATQAAGFDALAMHWDVMEERAATFGTAVDRDGWRLVGLMHIAETREQAYKDVEYGIEHWFAIFQTVAAFPQMAVGGDNVREMIDFVNETGLGLDRDGGRCLGPDRTADEAVQRRLRRLPAAGPRMGQPGRHPPQLRAHRQTGLSRFPGPGVEHAASQGTSRGFPPGVGGRPSRRRPSGERQVSGRGGSQDRRLTDPPAPNGTAPTRPDQTGPTKRDRPKRDRPQAPGYDFVSAGLARFPSRLAFSCISSMK
jgi:limonene 1,2-monooxygenase